MAHHRTPSTPSTPSAPRPARTPSPLYTNHQADEPAPNEQKLYGDVVRLEIPLRSVHGLRQVADELRGLATRLDCISRYSSGRPALTMMEVYTVVRQCNRKLDRIRGRGRPKKSRNKF
jgi:hypothetical protein